MILYAALLFAAALFLVHQYRNERMRVLNDIRNEMLRSLADLNFIVKSSTDHVDAMRYSAQTYIKSYPGDFRTTAFFRNLVFNKDWGGFAFDNIPLGFSTEDVGNLTGYGNLKTKGHDFVREVEMAFSLNPLFKAAKKNLPNLTWVYYISAQGFVNAYPWAPSSESHYTDKLLQHEFFTGGQPKNNPEHRRFWTSAYLDEYGKGVMVTVAAPIMVGARFFGTVAIDLTVDVLSSYMKNQKSRIRNGYVGLINDRRQLIASPDFTTQEGDKISSARDFLPAGLKDRVYEVLNLPEGEMVDIGSQIIGRFRMTNTPFTLLYITPESRIFTAATAAILPQIGIVVLLFALLLALHHRGRILSALTRSEESLNRRVAELQETKIYLERSGENLRILARDLARARDEADAANRAKSMFLANMSHELRTPLNAILGFSEVMEMEAFGKLGSDRYREYCRDIRESGMLLLELIDDILDLSKIEAGKLDLEETEVDVNAVAAACIGLVKSRADAKKISLELDVAEDFPQIRLDERALKQMLLNLLTNAVKFTGNNGRIRLSATVERGTDAIVIEVEDNGIGIEADELASVLDPFGQAQNPLVRSEKGTGLGLAITRSLVELHGGSISINSEPGKGTRVTLVLPGDRLILGDY